MTARVWVERRVKVRIWEVVSRNSLSLFRCITYYACVHLVDVESILVMVSFLGDYYFLAVEVREDPLGCYICTSYMTTGTKGDHRLGSE